MMAKMEAEPIRIGQEVVAVRFGNGSVGRSLVVTSSWLSGKIWGLWRERKGERGGGRDREADSLGVWALSLNRKALKT